MADSDKTLRLLIEMGVVGKEDVQAANALLAESGSTAATSASGAKDLGDSQRHLANEAHGAAAASKEHNVHLQGGRVLFRELNHLVPELGHLTHMSFMGMTAPVLLFGLALVKIKEHISEVNEELDKMGEKAAEAYASYKTNLADAIREEKFSTEKVDEYFKHFDEKSDATKKKLENLLALTKAENEGQLEKNKAVEAAELDFVKKKFASMMADGKKPGAKAENEELKKQEEEEINAIKDRFARENAVLKTAGEQAGATAAESIYTSLQNELSKLLMQAGPGGGPTDQQKAERAAKIKDSEQEIKTHQQNLGINETTLVAEKGGDAAAAKAARATADADADNLARARDKLAELNASNADRERIVYQDRLVTSFQRQFDADNEKAMLAELVVKREQQRIEQLAESIAELKQATVADKNLKAEIEKYTLKVKEAGEAVKHEASLAGIKDDARFFALNKETQHGKDIKAVGNFDYDGPKGRGLSIEQAMTALNYSEGQKQLLIEKILHHAVNTTTAWETLNRAVDNLNARTANGRNQVNGG